MRKVEVYLLHLLFDSKLVEAVDSNLQALLEIAHRKLDFTDGRPTSRQMDQLVRLVRGLMEEDDIPYSEVVPHRGVKVTACPGRDFPWPEFKRRIL